MKRRITALIMALCMALTMMPLHVHAEDTTYTVYLNQSSMGEGTVSGSGEYAVGETVTITATPAEGSCFYTWVVASGSASLSNASSQTTTFTMPAENVTITANFRYHVAGAYMNDANQHWTQCFLCSTLMSAKENHADADGNGLCDVCEYDLHTHNYSAATCTAPATCSCGDTTGGVDSSNHVGGTEIRDAKDASEFESGYTGDTYCLGCNTKIASGTTIPATHTHNYAAATCTTPATCSCGDTTGGVDSTNHTGGTEIRDAKAATEFEAGYTGDTYCKGCGDKLSSGSTIPATHVHSYSTATCTTPATCSCGETTDDVDKSNHVGGTETRGYEAAGEFTDGYTGDTYCLGCGDLLSSGSVIPATHTHSWEWTYDSGMHWEKCSICGESSTAAQAHTFETIVIPPTATEEGGYVSICSVCSYEEHLHIYSDATCTTPATCSCGATQGDVDKSNHVGGMEIRNAKDASEFEAGYTGDTYCLGCGDKLADGETIPATHQHSYDDYTYDRNGHWKVCSCGATTAAEDHEWYIYKNDTRKHYWRCDCGNNGWSSEHFDNTHNGRCDDCGYYTCKHDSYQLEYLNADEHTFVCTGCDYRKRESHAAREMRELEWVYTEEAHYYRCGCGAESALLDHNYKDDGVCRYCGYDSIKICNHSTRFMAFNYGNCARQCVKCGVFVGEIYDHVQDLADDKWIITENYHARECQMCKNPVEEYAHEIYTISTDRNYHYEGCAICKYAVGEKQPHNAVEYEKRDEEMHLFLCGDCKWWRLQEHSYTRTLSEDGKSCIRTCELCGEVNTSSHVYDVARPYAIGHVFVCGCGESSGEIVYHDTGETMALGHGDENGHYAYCTVCGYTETKAQPHNMVFGRHKRYLNMHANTCADCGYEAELSLHSYDTAYPVDQYAHAYGCECGDATEDYGTGEPHVDDDGNRKCDVCGLENAHTHSFRWTSAGQIYHTSACTDTDCGYVVTESHNDVDNDGECDQCGESIPTVIETSFSMGFIPDAPGAASSLETGNFDSGDLINNLFGGGELLYTPILGSPNENGSGLASGLVTGGSSDTAFGDAIIEAEQSYRVVTPFSQNISVNGGTDTPGILRITISGDRLADVIGDEQLQAIALHETESGVEYGSARIDANGSVVVSFDTDSQSPFVVLLLVPEDSTTTHTIASGENLTVIARKYGCTVDEIVALNSDLIENPSVISVGWVLMIPKK